MLFTFEKLQVRIRELSELRYREMQTIPSFRFLPDERGELAAMPPEPQQFPADTVMSLGEHWSGRDKYIWLHAEVSIPQHWSGQRVVGYFDFGKTGGGTNSGFESMCYLDGKPYQGVDSNHREVFLPANASGKLMSLTFRLWSGLEGGGPPREMEHRLHEAFFAVLDEATDDLYYTARAVVETIEVLHIDSPERAELLKALDRAFLLINWSRPGSDVFYQSIAEAGERLHAELAKIKKHHAVTVTCVGHTHIDVAWLWRLKHTREKSARSFSTVLRLFDMFPEYYFLQTQPQLYEYIKADYPEIYEQIRDKVREGKWEAGGAMWLEADCNVTSGESLVRQILLGTRFFKEEFDVECSYLWLPDVFGYSWALPQILLKSGIDTMMTTKISWSEYNRMPHDTFYWRGIDGSEILTHFITTPDPDPRINYYTYNGRVNAESVQGIWRNYRDKEFNQHLLLSYGYGDGGGGVNREMLELRRRLEHMPGLPHVVTGRAEDYFEQLQQTVKDTDQYVHMWDGELYLEFHRGTYTSQAYNKRMNRKLELLYRDTEWMGSLQAALSGQWNAYPQAALIDGWKIILRNQFHDIIPGSSIREVYEDSYEEYDQARQIAEQEWDKAVSGIVQATEPHGFAVFNSLAWDRTDVVKLPLEDHQSATAGSWFDDEGNELAVQQHDDHIHLLMTEIPSLGVKNIRFVPGKKGSQEPIPFTKLASGIVTPYYRIEWNKAGQLTQLFDLQADRNVLAANKKGNLLQVFEDKPLGHDAWNVDIFYQDKMDEVSELVSIEWTEWGPLRAAIRFQWKYMDSVIKQKMIVYRHSRRIDFETWVDWHEQQRLMKVAFPVEIRATEATYDIQFGNLKRPTHWNTSWDYARFETVGHQWADLSERGYGVSLLNDCKYGYDIKDNVMRLSLIKSSIHPDVQADQGEHRFTYALLPHTGDWLDGQTVQEAAKLNSPLSFQRGQCAHAPLALFRISLPNVTVDAVKKAESSNQMVLRVHEYAGARGTMQISSELSIVSWQECNLMEKPLGEAVNGSLIQCEMLPYEIKTFLIDFVN